MTPVDKEKSFPPSSPERADQTSIEHARISKIVTCILTVSIGLAVASAFCFTAKVSCAVALLVGSVALAALGIVIGVNSIADRFFPKKLAAAVHAIHATAMDMLAFTVQLLLYPTFALFDKMITPGNPDERPVLLVHGYLHNASAWIYTMFRLRWAGFRFIYTINLYPPLRSIDDYAEMVKARAEEIRTETGRDDLILVGHSMGGLVASAAASGLHVTHLITLGSPLKGTSSAYIGLGENARQMRPDSQFTQQLREGLSDHESSKDTKFYQIASTRDQLVPAKSALLPLSEKRGEMIVTDLGHAGLLYSPSVMDAVIRQLQS